MCDIACMAAASAPAKKTLYCFRCKRTIEEGKPFQLMRVGYYKKCTDEKGGLVLSEIVSLKDNFNK